jgi:hypothetical protein
LRVEMYSNAPDFCVSGRIGMVREVISAPARPPEGH